MDFLQPCSDLAPAMHITWDRGHEELDAIIRAQSDDALIVTVVEDYWPQAGLRWIRGDEVVDCRPLEATSPEVRVLDHLGVRPFAVADGLLDLAVLLSLPVFATAPVALYLERTGSREVHVGTVSELVGNAVVLDHISPSGEMSGERMTFRLSEVIGVEWGSDYLRALSILAGL